MYKFISAAIICLSVCQYSGQAIAAPYKALRVTSVGQITSAGISLRELDVRIPNLISSINRISSDKTLDSDLELSSDKCQLSDEPISGITREMDPEISGIDPAFTTIALAQTVGSDDVVETPSEEDCGVLCQNGLPIDPIDSFDPCVIFQSGIGSPEIFRDKSAINLQEELARFSRSKFAIVNSRLGAKFVMRAKNGRGLAIGQMIRGGKKSAFTMTKKGQVSRLSAQSRGREIVIEDALAVSSSGIILVEGKYRKAVSPKLHVFLLSPR